MYEVLFIFSYYFFSLFFQKNMTNDLAKVKELLENSNFEEVNRQVDEMNKQAITQKKILVWELVQNLLAHKINNTQFTAGISYKDHLIKAEEIFENVVKPQVEQLKNQEWQNKNPTIEINKWI